MYLVAADCTMEFYDFPFSWEWKIIPTDFHSIIFQKGRYTTNQMRSMMVFMTFFFWGYETTGLESVDPFPLSWVKCVGSRSAIWTMNGGYILILGGRDSQCADG